MTEYLKKVYTGTSGELFAYLLSCLEGEKKAFIVTANPEVLMKGGGDGEYNALLLDSGTIITPDGIGVVKAANMAGIPLKERITGVETVCELLRLGSEKKLSVYFYGSAPEVLSALSEVLKNEYPGLTVKGLRDGYSNDDDEVFADIRAEAPDIIIIALGVPRQEKLIYKHLGEFSKGVFVGVGGSLDVISGTKKRAPRLFIKLNCEWLYRIIKEPSRLKRFWDGNVKFMLKVKKELKEGQE